MSNEIIAALIGLFAGIIGSGGFLGGILFYRLKRLEIAYEARVSSIVEHKIAVYRTAIGFLRRINSSYQMGEAVTLANEIADELMLWGSNDVTKGILTFLRIFAINPSLEGIEWREVIGPIIKAMVVDVNPGNSIEINDILEQLCLPLTQQGETAINQIKSYAYSDPKQFSDIANVLDSNMQYLHKIRDQKYGDPVKLLAAFGLLKNQEP
jgi:uncharacterized protein (UPF0297 family)